MKLVILATEEMLPLPENVSCIREYGSETIVQQTGLATHITRGIAMLIEAEDDALVEWLKPFDGIWTSNNPSSGQWVVVHIKVGV